jgi:hypothetical protein
MSLPKIEMKKLLKIVTAIQTFTNKLTEHELMHTKKVTANKRIGSIEKQQIPYL